MLGEASGFPDRPSDGICCKILEYSIHLNSDGEGEGNEQGFSSFQLAPLLMYVVGATDAHHVRQSLTHHLSLSLSL
jgi:hypothetical protein